MAYIGRNVAYIGRGVTYFDSRLGSGKDQNCGELDEVGIVDRWIRLVLWGGVRGRCGRFVFDGRLGVFVEEETID